MSNDQTIDKIKAKYQELGENPETYLKGLLFSKFITYWDYVEVDTLLTLQKPRTDYVDEEIFIMYHQITELVFKLILHEIRQVVETDEITEPFLITKLGRMNRYAGLLITSFDIMREGMDYDAYNEFRNTLTPASGLQSGQFRMIEIYCTRMLNLVSEEKRSSLPDNPTVEDYFKHVYWLDAGTKPDTGEKTNTLRLFEEKYMEQFITTARKVQGKTIEERMAELGNDISEELRDKLREFDHTYNVAWPLVHLNTAQHYLDKKGETRAATGGSKWKRYLHPKFQHRVFFPELWSTEELQKWGAE